MSRMPGMGSVSATRGSDAGAKRDGGGKGNWGRVGSETLVTESEVNTGAVDTNDPNYVMAYEDESGVVMEIER